MSKVETVVVTRHEALVAYLKEISLVDDSVEVVAHATPETVRGKRVIGVLPLHLAAEAAWVVVVPLATPPEMRGVELTIEEVRKFAGTPTEYVVRRVG